MPNTSKNRTNRHTDTVQTKNYKLSYQQLHGQPPASQAVVLVQYCILSEMGMRSLKNVDKTLSYIEL